MADEIKVETEVETTEVATQDVVEADVVKEVEEFEKKEKNREGFIKRKAQEVDDVEEDDKVTLAVQKALDKVLPKIQASTESMVLDQKINSLSESPAVRKLIKLHFENTVNPDLGSIDERLEAAQAIATRKQTQKVMKELTVAAQNRSQIQNTSVGQNSEVKAVSDGMLSDTQLNELKRRGWNDEKIIRFKKNLIKNRGAI